MGNPNIFCFSISCFFEAYGDLGGVLLFVSFIYSERVPLKGGGLLPPVFFFSDQNSVLPTGGGEH